MFHQFPFAMLASLPEPVLSVYLDANPVRHLNRSVSHGYLGWFAGEAKRLLSAAQTSEQNRLRTEIDRVERFLQEKPLGGRGFALFAGLGIWHMIPLPVEPENELHWGRPMLWQLAAIAHRHRPSCVVALDRSGARLFSSTFGEVMPLETREFRADASDWKQMQGYHSAERRAGMPHGAQHDLFERRTDAQYQRFLAETAQRLEATCEAQGLNQVLLIGPLRLTAAMARKLPPALRKRTVQVPHLWSEWEASSSVERIAEALTAFDAASQEQRVGELLNRGRSVVTGAEETLAMLQRGKLRALVAEESFDPVLRYCAACDIAGASSTQRCPRCRGALVNRTMHEVLPQLLIRYSCASEFLNGAPAQHLRALGSIGGWLRRRRSSTSPEAARQSAASAPLTAALA